MSIDRKTVIRQRIARSAILALAALVIGAGIGWVQVHGTSPVLKSAYETPIAGIKIGGPFSLTDQDGRTVTEKDYAGMYKLIYFGFTSCPAICPTELAKMSRALKDVGAAGEKIQPLFITVDPARDDVKTLKGYVGLFHPRLQGLTGGQAQIDAVKKSYRIYAARDEKDAASGDDKNYNVNHSSYIYFMSPRDELIAIFRTGDTAEDIAAAIKKSL